MSETTGTVDIAQASSSEPQLSTLLTKYQVHSATRLFFHHLRIQAQPGSTESMVRVTIQKHYPLRTARAPKGAAAPNLADTYEFDLGDRSETSVAATIQSLRAEANVVYAEEDKPFRVLYVPNDPSYSSHGSWGQNYDDLYGLKMIGTTQAWDTTHGEGATVAVIDSGIDVNHPDIQANVWINHGEIPGNGIDDDHNGFIDDVRGWDFVGANHDQPAEDNDPNDVYGHGTHVAGTIAAAGDNNMGVLGVAWQAKVMAVKGIADDGQGYSSYLARAIIYAVDNGADVINASWGGTDSSQTLVDAIDYAHAMGVVFVAAAGNDSTDVSTFYPASVPNAIAVSSISPTRTLSSFSNHGSKIELCAPGQDILSLEAGTTGYVRKDGTSMAAPHVSGVAALIIARHPEFTSEQVRQALRLSATDLGPPGRDPSFGYGLVNAAQAVLVDQALEAEILSPANDTPISSATALTGTAGGPGFDHYVLDFGSGTSPDTWTVLQTSSSSITNGTLALLDPSTLPDGIYTVRLRVFDTSGAAFSDQVELQVRYLQITSPAPPPVAVLTQEVKPGATIKINGTAAGPSFQSYLLEWAPGAAATAGWSTAGFTLATGGAAPVADGTLGTWAIPANLTGDNSIRLTVQNNGFSSVATTAVYAEPALLSGDWPKLVGPVLDNDSPQPVRQPDGSIRLMLYGQSNSDGTSCYSYALDGSLITAPLDFGGAHQPCVGNLDGQPGDEVVLADGLALKILSSTLAPIRTITVPSRVFWPDQTVLADLDHDGIPEIIAPARNTQSPTGITYRESGALYVYRADGTLFSNRYPLPISSPLTSDGSFNGSDGVLTVVPDLDGDGQKEIVMAIEASDYSGYTLEAIDPTGTPHAGWPTPSFPGQVKYMAAADLDHDGTTELVILEYSQENNTDQIRVLNSDGTTRPGWPVAQADGASLAIGDLDRDGHNEIVVAASHFISIWNDRGERWCPDWPSNDQYTNPLIADIDGDGYPEIVVNAYQIDGKTWLKCFGRNGRLVASWPLYGLNGLRPFHGIPLVGDFNNDGLTDIAVQLSLTQGEGSFKAVVSAALSCLTPGTSFRAPSSDWPSIFHDLYNTRTLPLATQWPQVITFDLLPNRAFTTDPITLSATASSGLAVSFSVRSGPATVSGNQLTLTGTGTVSVEASQSGNAMYTASAPVDRSFMVTPVNSSLAITTQPPDSVASLGGNVTFTVVAEGVGPFTYQWRKDGANLADGPNLSGTTTASLTLINVQLGDAGGYDVVVSNASGSVTSNVAHLRFNLPGVVAVSVGSRHTLLICADGTLWGFGANGNGQLGSGGNQLTPVLLATDVVAASAGGSHSLFVKSDGSLWGLGNNNQGELGDGTHTNRTTPIKIFSGHVAAIAAGGSHSLVLMDDGTVWGMGASNGQLGLGTTGSMQLVPVQLVTGVVAISAGDGTSAFLKSDHTLWCTGGNSSGQLGTGDTTTVLTPIPIASGVSQVCMGSAHSLFIKQNGELWGMGSIYAITTAPAGANVLTPVLIDTNVTSAQAAGVVSLYLKPDQTARAMGINSYGQCGDGTPVSNTRLTPRQVATGIAAVGVGGNGFTAFLKTDGTLLTSGYNADGELGDGTVVDRTTAVTVFSGSVNPPTAPLTVSAVRTTSSGAAHLVWDRPLGSTHYEVWRNSADATGTATLLADVSQTCFYDDTAAHAGDTYYYWIRAANLAGSSDYSATATLVYGPTIASQPSSQTVSAGDAVTLAVTAAGTAPFSYQWRRNGSAIPGATNSSYSITSATTANAGDYDVIVSNAAGSVTSDLVTLTVNRLSQIITFATLSDLPYTATPLTLSATASSGLPVSFSIVFGPATISVNQLTLTGTGAIAVEATQTGDAIYTAATPVQRSFMVTTDMASWALGHFNDSQRADSSISGPTADPDHDGLTNLMEYALGLEPMAASAAGRPEVAADASNWTYTFNRPTDRPDLTYTVEVSTDLVNWTSTGVTLSKTASANGSETWQASVPAASASTLFFRLKVAQQP